MNIPSQVNFESSPQKVRKCSRQVTSYKILTKHIIWHNHLPVLLLTLQFHRMFILFCGEQSTIVRYKYTPSHSHLANRILFCSGMFLLKDDPNPSFTDVSKPVQHEMGNLILLASYCM